MHFAFGNYFFRSISIVVNILIRRLLGPEIIGIFSYLLVFSHYLDFLVAPIRSAMDQEVPMMRGSGQHELVEDYTATCHGLVVLNSFIGTLVMWAFYWMAETQAIRYGFFIFGISVFFESYSCFWQIFYKINMRFSEVSKIMVTIGIFQPVITLVLTYIYSYQGFFIGRVLMFVVMCWLYMRKCIRLPAMKLKIQFVRIIYSRGFPLTLLTFVMVNVQNIDKLMIKNFISMPALGMYNIGDMLFQNLYILPLSIFAVYAPKFLEHVAAGDEIAQRAERVTGIVRMVMVPVVVGIWVALPLVFEYVIPDFRDGLWSANLLLVALYLYSLSNLYNLFLISKKHYSTVMYLSVLCVIIGASLNVVAIRFEQGITGIAAATLISYSFYGYSLIFIGMRKMKCHSSQFKKHFLMDIYALFPVIILFLLDKYYFVGIRNIIHDTLARFTISALPLFIVLNIMNKSYNLYSILSKKFKFND